MTNQVHPTAIISEQACLGSNNIIGANVQIDADVVIGNNNIIMTGTVLKSGLRMGDGNTVHEYSVLSGLPQDIAFDQNTTSFVRIGNGNVFREYLTVHRASQAEQVTLIGDNNYFMTQVHIAHDCEIANHVIIAPSTALGGFVTVEERAFISGGVMIHQFVHIGAYAMLGGNAKITLDVLPYMIVDGNPAQVNGLNKVGLRRAGFKLQEMKVLKAAYQLLFKTSYTLEEKIDRVLRLEHPLSTHICDFIARSKRGFHRDKG